MLAYCTRGLVRKIPPSAEHGSLDAVDAVDAATTEWTPSRAPAVDQRRSVNARGSSSCRQSALPGTALGGPGPSVATDTAPAPVARQEKTTAVRRQAVPVYGVAAPIASAAQAPNKVQASMASTLSGLRQRCRENNDAGLRQASMTRLQSRKTRWRRPRNLAARRLSRRDGNRTTAHWTMRRAFVYERRRYPGGIDMQLPLRRHRAAVIAMARWRREPASAAMPAAQQHCARAVLYLLTGNVTLWERLQSRQALPVEPVATEVAPTMMPRHVPRHRFRCGARCASACNRRRPA